MEPVLIKLPPDRVRSEPPVIFPLLVTKPSLTVNRFVTFQEPEFSPSPALLTILPPFISTVSQLLEVPVSKLTSPLSTVREVPLIEPKLVPSPLDSERLFKLPPFTSTSLRKIEPLLFSSPPVISVLPSLVISDLLLRTAFSDRVSFGSLTGVSGSSDSSDLIRSVPVFVTPDVPPSATSVVSNKPSLASTEESLAFKVLI